MVFVVRKKKERMGYLAHASLKVASKARIPNPIPATPTIRNAVIQNSTPVAVDNSIVPIAHKINAHKINAHPNNPTRQINKSWILKKSLCLATALRFLK